jgi:hypothetical protein
MVKFVKFSTVLQTPLYQEIIRQCVIRLEVSPYVFRKDEVMEAANAVPFADSINWSFVQRWLEEGDDKALVDGPLPEGYGEGSLIPVVGSFWDGRDGVSREDIPEDRMKHPGKYIAQGHGKRTAGYALVCEENGELALKVQRIKCARARGVNESRVATEQSIAKHAPTLRPRIQNQREEEGVARFPQQKRIAAQ